MESIEFEYETDFKQAQKNRKDKPYRHFHKLFPDTDMRKGLKDAVGQIAADADEEHLTFVYIYAHGAQDGFEIGLEDFMRYEELTAEPDDVEKSQTALFFLGFDTIP